MNIKSLNIQKVEWGIFAHNIWQQRTKKETKWNIQTLFTTCITISFFMSVEFTDSGWQQRSING